MIGQTISRYRIVEKLGGGGMGEVWRAQHQLLAREAAIKLVRADVLVNEAHAPIVQERFRREAQTLASLRSRHTIELYDYGVTADGAFWSPFGPTVHGGRLDTDLLLTRTTRPLTIPAAAMLRVAGAAGPRPETPRFR